MSSPTMMPMSLEEIAQAVQGRLIAGTAAIDTPVATSTFTDSRQIVEGSVFVAIAGERVDGHDYVSKVGAQGAVAAIVDHEIDGAGVPQIVVEDTVLALGVGQAQYRTPACVGNAVYGDWHHRFRRKNHYQGSHEGVAGAHRTDDCAGRIVQQ